MGEQETAALRWPAMGAAAGTCLAGSASDPGPAASRSGETWGSGEAEGGYRSDTSEGHNLMRFLPHQRRPRSSVPPRCIPALA